jgi:hypothetical protein
LFLDGRDLDLQFSNLISDFRPVFGCHS